MDAAYGARMDTPEVIQQLHALGSRIDALAERVQQLTAENRGLRSLTTTDRVRSAPFNRL